MLTTVLAYVILLMGFITFLGGLFGALILIFEEVAKTGHVPFRYYAMIIGLIIGRPRHDRHWPPLTKSIRRVRFAPRADIRPMPAFMSTRPTAPPKINLLKLRRSARAGLPRR
jgi:hypothetical protein